MSKTDKEVLEHLKDFLGYYCESLNVNHVGDKPLPKFVAQLAKRHADLNPDYDKEGIEAFVADCEEDNNDILTRWEISLYNSPKMLRAELQLKDGDFAIILGEDDEVTEGILCYVSYEARLFEANDLWELIREYEPDNSFEGEGNSLNRGFIEDALAWAREGVADKIQKTYLVNF